MAFLRVIPIDEIHRTIRADLEGDAGEPRVVGLEEIGQVFGDVAGTFGHEGFLIDASAVDVEKERAAAVFGREVVAVVDGEAAVGVTAAEVFRLAVPGVGIVTGVVFVVGDGVEVVVNVGIEVPKGIALAQVITALDDVPEVGDHAGFAEPVAVFVVVEAPGIGGAVGENFEGFPDRVETPVGAIERGAVLGRGAGCPDIAMGEDAVAAIQPAVGSPDKTVQRLVGVLPAKAIQQDGGGGVRFVIAIGIRYKNQVGGGPDVNPAEAQLEAAGAKVELK